MELNSNGKYEVTYQELVDFAKTTRDNYLKELKEDLRNKIFEGEECKCCASFIKATKVSLSKSMINSLLSLYRITGRDTNVIVHKDEVYRNWGKKSNVLGKLKHWRFVTQYGDGTYSITNEGLKFINGLPVNEYEYIYDDRKVKSNDDIPMKTIHQLQCEWK